MVVGTVEEREEYIRIEDIEGVIQVVEEVGRLAKQRQEEYIKGEEGRRR